MRDRYNRLCATPAPNYAWITSAIHDLTVKSWFFNSGSYLRELVGENPMFSGCFLSVQWETVEQTIVY
jgi:hypothetical protein